MSINFKDYPDKTAPIDADNLNKLNNVAIGITKPTLNEEIWVQKSKNLLNISSFETKTLNGVTFTNNGNGSITINGTATDSFGVSFGAFVLKKGTYHLSLNANTLNSFYIYDYDTYENILSKEETTTLTKDYDNVGFDTWVVQGDVFNNITISPQLEVGDKATSFEAYVEKKIYAANNNGGYDEFLDVEDITLKQIKPTFNSSYVYSTDLDYECFQMGKMVILNIHTIAFSQALPSLTKFIYGLPKPKSDIIFALQGHMDAEGATVRCCLEANSGDIRNHYDGVAHYGASSTKQYGCILVYEAKE